MPLGDLGVGKTRRYKKKMRLRETAAVQDLTCRVEDRADHHQTARAFLEDLTAAFLAGDFEGCFGRYEEPVLLVAPHQSYVFNDPTQLHAQAKVVRAHFMARGLSDMRLDILREQNLGREIVLVDANWIYLNQAGREIGRRTATYLLRRFGNSFQVATHIMHTDAHEHHRPGQRIPG